MSTRFSENGWKKNIGTQIKAGVMALLLLAVVSGCERFQSAQAQIEKANQALEKNDTATAVIHLKNALQKDPDNARARYVLGKTYLARSEPQNAEKELERAQSLKFDANLVLPLLAKSMLLSGKLKELQNIDAQLATETSARAEITAIRANGLLASGTAMEARILYEEALKLNPKSVTALFGMARLAAANGGLQEADDIADKILKIAPRDIETILLRVDIQKLRRNFVGAADYAKQALAIDAKDIRPRISLALLALESGQLEEVLGQSEEIKKRFPNSGMGAYLRALVELNNKNIPLAQTEIQKALKLAPNYVPALILGATVELRLGSYALAEQYLKTAMGLAPGNQTVARMMANVQLRSGHPESALELLKVLVGKNPDNMELQSLIAEAYFRSGDMENAHKHFSQAAKTEQYARSAHTGMALTHLAAGELERAAVELESATKAQGISIQADLILISARIQQRQFDKALAAIDVLANKMPNSPTPNVLRANVALMEDNQAKARDLLEKSLKIDPGYFYAVRLLARMDQASKRSGEAQKRVEEFIKRNEKHVEALITLAELKMSASAPADEVVSVLRRAQAIDPQQIQATEALGRYLLTSGKYKEAMEEIQRGLAIKPDTPSLIDLQGMAHMGAGRPADAVSSYTRLTSLQAKNELVWIRLSQAQSAAGESQAAVTSINRAVRLNPKNPASLELAVALSLANKSYTEALALSHEAQKNLPKSGLGWVLEGDVLAGQKMYMEAANRYGQALKIQPDPAVFVRKLQSLRLADKSAEADKSMDDWLKVNPRDVVVHAYAGGIEIGRKHNDAALSHYKEVLALQSDNVIALNNVAWLLNEKRDPAALDYIQKALRIEPKHPVLIDTRGMIFLGQGKTAEALADLKRAAEYGPNNLEIHLNYARALLKAGKKEDAKKELATLRRLGTPDMKEIAALGKDLE